MPLKFVLVFFAFLQVNCENFEVLTENFFSNLKMNPKLSIQNDLNETSKQFIEDQISNYVNLVTKYTQKQKRSLLDDVTKTNNSVYLLEAMQQKQEIAVKFPEDLIFFQMKEKTFFASLESENIKSLASYLTVYDFKKFNIISKIRVENGTRLASINMGNFTLLAVAEKTYEKISFSEKSGIYQFDGSKLMKIQSIDTNFANDVIVWKMHNDVYMSISQFKNQSYEIEIPIYKWLGKHFDLIQNLPSKGATKIEFFENEAGKFLAVANFRDNFGNTKIYSEIFKFNYHYEKFELYQRLLTKACADLKVFKVGERNETFLVVANNYERDINREIKYETDSIIYKFVDGYFIPFQSLALNAIEMWSPSYGTNGEFVLLASSKFDGLKFFQYDGWSFRQIFIKATNLKNLKSIRSIFNNSIVVSQKHTNGKIYKLQFKVEQHLNEIFDEMKKWCNQGLEKFENLNVDSILGKRGDIDEDFEEMESKLTHLNALIEEKNQIVANKVVFNNSTFIENLNTTKINNHGAEFLENVINTSESFNLDKAEFRSIESESFESETINAHEKVEILHTSEDLVLNSVKVDGSLVVPEGLNVEGELNGKRVAKNTKIQFLTVKNLTVGGYINEVDVPTLDKYTLKKNGDQIITSNYTFEELRGRNLDVFGKISGKKLPNLVSTDTEISINQETIFNTIYVNNLKITKTLNDIKVENNKFDILLKNITQEQDIADKNFNDVTVFHAIYLQGHINSKNLENMNPMITIDDNIFVQGDKKITQAVTIEETIKAKNFVTLNGHNFKKLKEKGLKLTDKVVKAQLLFAQQLNVDEVFVDKINNKSPGDFVVTGSEETQIIEGSKIFLNDLFITGATNANKINDIDVEKMQNNYLKTEGEQTVLGKHHVKNVVAENLSTNETKINENVKISRSIEENVMIGNFQQDVIKAKTITVTGFINDLSFDEIINDTVTKNMDTLIQGQKFFKNLSIQNLYVDNGYKIPEEILDLNIDENLNISNIKIKHLFFENECNLISKKNFGNYKNHTLGQLEFENVVVLGKVIINSKKINKIEINDIVNNSVKLDEPFDFKHATFEEIVSAAPIILRGSIENFDFENVAFTENLKQILDVKTFTNLTIKGEVYLEHINKFCNMSKAENLKINGEAFFAKGPTISKVNNFDVGKIKRDAWFRNEDANIEGRVNFEDVIFEKNIEIEGFFDNISLSLLHENYLSKTKNQNITATFQFVNKVTCDNTAVRKMEINEALVNDVSLEEFFRTALINNSDQIFENNVYFDNVKVKTLSGNFKVNGLDLNNDVMRYDKVNMVTAEKTFENLNLGYLKIDKNITVQNVDILNWFKNSVLKSTDFNITGKNSFENVIFHNGFELLGTLNGLQFNHVMLKNNPQEITGAKIIKVKPLEVATFKGIKLRGFLNGVEISELINHQAYKDQNNVFKTTMNLYKTLSTNNLLVKTKFQGVNVTELISNVTNLGLLNNLLNQYEALLDVSKKLEESIQGQAYFLDHYKTVQTVPVSNSKVVLCPDNIKRLGIITIDSDTRMDLYSWNEEKFVINATIRFIGQINYVNQIMSGKYLYFEKNSEGFFSLMKHNLKNYFSLHTNGTKATISFNLPSNNEICTLFIYEKGAPNIFCDNKETGIYFKESLPIYNALEATSIIIDDILYLVIITQPKEPDWHTYIYQYQDKEFKLYQSLFGTHPKSVDTISYKNSHYLAITSGHLQNAMYSGSVEIRKFNPDLEKFEYFQVLELHAPISSTFSIFPSQELILYVVSDNPIEPLLVFRYEGVAGFKLKIKGSALPKITKLEQFNVAGRHLILAQNNQELDVIEAVFKGVEKG